MKIRSLLHHRMPPLVAYVDRLVGRLGDVDEAADLLAASDREGAHRVLLQLLNPNCLASYRDKARGAATLPTTVGGEEQRMAAIQALLAAIAPGSAGLFATIPILAIWPAVALVALLMLLAEVVAGPTAGLQTVGAVALAAGCLLGPARLTERMYGRHETVVVEALGALGRLNATDAIPSILGWLGTQPYRTRLQLAALGALVALEPVTDDDGAGWLTPKVEAEIARRLRTGDDAPLARILGRVGGTACLPRLEEIAMTHRSPLLRAAVKEELSAIRARAALQREQARLLQPASAPQTDPGQLLRPASGPPEVDEQQLLRPGEGPKE